MHLKKCLITITLAMASSINVHAGNSNQFESIDHLNNLVKEYIQSRITLNADERLEVKISELGNQLQLTQCSQPIQITLPVGTTPQQLSALEISCTDTSPWHVYVPIAMHIYTKVIVAKQTIPPKEIINASMIDYIEHDKNQLYSGYYKDVSEVVGQSPTSTMVAGTVLTKNNIQRPILIKNNQPVSIISNKGMIMVKAAGVAKSSGAYNDMIKVLNPSSKRIIDAVVMNSSTVEVK